MKNKTRVIAIFIIVAILVVGGVVYYARIKNNLLSRNVAVNSTSSIPPTLPVSKNIQINNLPTANDNTSIVTKKQISSLIEGWKNQITLLNQKIVESGDFTKNIYSDMAKDPYNLSLQQAGKNLIESNKNRELAITKLVGVYTAMINIVTPYSKSDSVLEESKLDPIGLGEYQTDLKAYLLIDGENQKLTDDFNNIKMSRLNP